MTTQPKKLFHLSNALSLEIEQDSEDFDQFNLELTADVNEVHVFLEQRYVLQQKFHDLGFLGMDGDGMAIYYDHETDNTCKIIVEFDSGSVRLKFPEEKLEEIRKWVDECVNASINAGAVSETYGEV